MCFSVSLSPRASTTRCASYVGATATAHFAAAHARSEIFAHESVNASLDGVDASQRALCTSSGSTPRARANRSAAPHSSASTCARTISAGDRAPSVATRQRERPRRGSSAAGVSNTATRSEAAAKEPESATRAESEPASRTPERWREIARRGHAASAGAPANVSAASPNAFRMDGASATKTDPSSKEAANRPADHHATSLAPVVGTRPSRASDTGSSDATEDVPEVRTPGPRIARHARIRPAPSTATISATT